MYVTVHSHIYAKIRTESLQKDNFVFLFLSYLRIYDTYLKCRHHFHYSYYCEQPDLFNIVI